MKVIVASKMPVHENFSYLLEYLRSPFVEEEEGRSTLDRNIVHPTVYQKIQKEGFTEVVGVSQVQISPSSSSASCEKLRTPYNASASTMNGKLIRR